MVKTLAAKLSSEPIQAYSITGVTDSNGKRHTRLIINELEKNSILFIAAKSMPTTTFETIKYYLWQQFFWKPVTIIDTDTQKPQQVLINVNSLVKRILYNYHDVVIFEETIREAVKTDTLGTFFFTLHARLPEA